MRSFLLDDREHLRALRELHQLVMVHLREPLQVQDEPHGGCTGLQLDHLHEVPCDDAGEDGHQGDGVDGEQGGEEPGEGVVDQEVAVADGGAGLEGEPEGVGDIVDVRVLHSNTRLQIHTELNHHHLL